MGMNLFDSWSREVASVLAAESTLAGKFLLHGGELGDAREAFLRDVLRRVVPDLYHIGTGQLVDTAGNRSRQIDVVVARKDFPILSFAGDKKLYPIEAVLATIEVKSHLDRNTLGDALENCASVADLGPNVVASVLDRLAASQGLTKEGPGSYTHPNPLRTGQFDLLARPSSYIFGYRGYKGPPNTLAEAMAEWSKSRESQGRLAMRHLPSVVVTEGCFSWRNAPPYQIDRNVLCLIGHDPAPLRLLVLHVLYSLSLKIPCTPDAAGIVPNIHAYLQQMDPPMDFAVCLGQAVNKPLQLDPANMPLQPTTFGGG